ncbi:MAG: hypothetical protein COT74_09665 [Bdellovibrionales bacterium CG10_big_fil_rev_8_21_14_0_10_45_34]|nr:MAG: hypothetical protein COT74_09665 [Bdellovibrionales bacterium CG10_big_fil_rev_8_21_14_0_10_45_34]
MTHLRTKQIIAFLFLASAVLFLFSSCTTLSQKDCESMDWYSKGKSDGVAGDSANKFAKYSSRCDEHGIQPDKPKYQEGYAAGLAIFCTFDSGENFGLSGSSYQGVCSGDSEKDFLKGFHIGQKEFRLQTKEAELANREKELRKQSADLDRKQEFLKKMPENKCTFDSDCVRDDDCSFGKCRLTASKCSFDSDCKVRGECNGEKYCIGSDCQEIRQCRYDD